MQLMAGWLYIIKQAAGDMPEETTPAKTHSLNTVFQEAITHRILGEEHPEEGPQLLPPCLYCPAALWFSCRNQKHALGLSILYLPWFYELHCPSWF